MIWEIPKLSEFIKKPKKVAKLSEFYDNFHMLTIYVIGFFALFTGAKTHFGNPIDCVISKQHDDVKSWRQYIQHYCLFYGTFRYNFTRNSTDDLYGDYTPELSVNYYQWVPLFFGVQVCFFFLPFWCWKYMQHLIPLDMAFVVEYTNQINKEKTCGQTKERVGKIVDYLHDYFKNRHLRKSSPYLPTTAAPGLFYMITKLLFIVNVVFQIKLICAFLGVDTWTWAFKLLQEFMNEPFDPHTFNMDSYRSRFHAMVYENELNKFQYFPILVGCNYILSESVDSLAQHTTQCIIPVNVINEKIFVGIYLWFYVLVTLSVIGAVKWAIRMKSRKLNEAMVFSLIRKTLQSEDFPVGTNYNDYRYNFVNKYLCADGIFLVYIMYDSNGFLKTEEVIGALFKKYFDDTVLEPLQSAPSLSNKSLDQGMFSQVNYGFEPHLNVHQKI